jgi:hypothetical protein
MFRKNIVIISFLLCVVHAATAQQFMGYYFTNYTNIQQVPYNPAWVNTAIDGAEINLASFSLLLGNNAYAASRNLLFGATYDSATVLMEGKDYWKDDSKSKKRLWMNADILGPAVSITYKKQHQFGIYTRARVIMNAGNMTQDNFLRITDTLADYEPFEYVKTGFSAHSFGEVGITYGRMLRDDEYAKLRVGATLKYLVGFNAINIYAKELKYQRVTQDSIGYLEGEVSALYTYNTNAGSTGDLGQRAGRWGLGLDVGIQYEYYPQADPNKKTKYLYSVAAAITDIGTVGYVGDKGSGTYAMNLGKTDFEVFTPDRGSFDYGIYLSKLTRDTLARQTEPAEKFSIGLPTALRLNGDLHLGSGIFISVNSLLNMRGNSARVFRPGYVSYLNFTPRGELGPLKIGLPITLFRFRTLMAGAFMNLGPLYFGSASAFSSLLAGNQISNIDIYGGLTLKIRPRKERDAYDMGKQNLMQRALNLFRGSGESAVERSRYCPPTK